MSAIHQLVLMPRKGIVKSEKHRVHAIHNERPLCGGGYQAKAAPAWQDDIGPVNCHRCLAILERKAKRK